MFGGLYPHFDEVEGLPEEDLGPAGQDPTNEIRRIHREIIKFALFYYVSIQK